ncbi:MAG: hypothetical protein CMN60_21475 [Sphingobium sp.]|nr:hypothetical protein [Sphingobium sp.]
MPCAVKASAPPGSFSRRPYIPTVYSRSRIISGCEPEKLARVSLRALPSAIIRFAGRRSDEPD